MRRADAVLFDLDGTLADSAPDLAGAANELRVSHGLAPLPLAELRPMVSAGARGMLGVAFGCAPGDERFEPLRAAFLALYEQRLVRETVVFEPLEPVLRALEAQAIRWGIVTNKAERLTLPIVRGLALHERAAVVVAGDTTPHAKPHPEPLLEAARRLRIAPGRCVYVGDDARDIQAGRAAGMATIAVRWGYLGDGAPIDEWGADRIVEHPDQLLHWLELP